MKSTVKERLTEYLKAKRISKSEFGKVVGVSNAYVSAIRKTISTEKIQSIAASYPDLNIEWLLTGEGEMLKTQSANSVVTGDVSGNGNQFVAGNNNVLSDRQGNYTAHPKSEDVEVVEAEEVEIKETIVLGADIINQEGVDLGKELHKAPEEMALDVEVKPTQDVLPPHEVKIYTENDEMAPDIEPNDPVFARLIPSPKLYKPRYMYLVNLEYGSVVRWVVPESNGCIRLVSRKGSDVVTLASVKAMFEVVAITKRPKTMPIDLTTEEQRIERKETQIDTILHQQGELISIIKKQVKD